MLRYVFSLRLLALFSAAPSLWASSWGLFVSTTGDRLDADVTQLVPGHPLQLKAREFSEDILLRPVHARFWLSRTSPSQSVASGNDMVLLRSRQRLRGTVKELTETHLTFHTAWGQDIQIPRKALSSIEPGKAENQVWLESDKWARDERRTRHGPDSTWMAEPWALINLAPKQNQLTRTFKGEFQHCTLEADIKFASVPQFYQLMVTESDNTSQRPPLSIRYSSAAKKLYLNGMGIMAMSKQIDLPRSLQKETHFRFILYLDPTQHENRLYLNDELMFQWRTTEDENAPGWKNPRVMLDFRHPDPVVVQRLGIRNVERFLPPDLLNKNTSRLRFYNGDALDAKVLSIQDGQVTVEVSGNPLHLPLTQVGAIQLHPTAKTRPRVKTRIFLHAQHPFLEAKTVRLEEDHLVVQVEGLPDPFQIPRESLAAMEWPRKKGGIVPEDHWVLLLEGGQEVSGKILSIDDHSLHLHPDWSIHPLELVTRRLVAASRKQFQKAEELGSFVMLQDMSWLPGQLQRVLDDRFQVDSGPFGTHPVLAEHIRLVSAGTIKSGTWLLDIGQSKLEPQNRVSRMRVSQDILQPSTSPHAAGLHVNQTIPSNSLRYVIHVKLEEAQVLNGFIQLERLSLNRERYGLSVHVNQKNLMIQSGSAKPKNIKLPDRGQVKDIEVVVDKKEKQLQVMVNGQDLGILASWEGQKLFHEKGHTVHVYLMPRDLKLASVQILPWNDEAELKAFRDHAIVTGGWSGTQYTEHVNLQTFLPAEQEKPDPHSYSGVLLPASPLAEPAETQGPIVYLGIRHARLHSKHLTLSPEGTWQIRHDAFPKDLTFSGEQVTEIIWKPEQAPQTPVRWPDRNSTFLRAR